MTRADAAKKPTRAKTVTKKTVTKKTEVKKPAAKKSVAKPAAKKTASAAKPAVKKPAAAKTAVKKPASKKVSAAAVKLCDRIVKVLDERKAENISVIDLEGKSSIGDFMVVATGTSPRHVSALAGYVVEAMEEAGLTNPGIEGHEQGDWVLVDGLSVIVHLFRPEVREMYNLEKMWAVPGGIDVVNV